MQIILIKKENLYKYPFPNNLISSYWINDNDEYGNNRDLIMIERKEDNWVLMANDKCRIKQVR